MINKKIKIFWLSAEVAPLVKVGGLADVAGSLPPALFKIGCDIRLSLPYYGSIKTPAKILLKGLKVVWGKKETTFDVYLATLPNTSIPVYLIKHPLFSGPEVYTKSKSLERFSLWSKASLVLITALDFVPDVLHLNDWHAALVLDFLPEFRQEYPSVFSRVKILYTIHNLANQGYDARRNLNPMAGGIKHADYINTVSPTYAKEILTKEYGAGLNRNLLKRRRNLSGILNGIDLNRFNPQTDSDLSWHYSARNLSGKFQNKLALQKTLGLEVSPAQPLLAFVARLSWQKGVELFTAEFFSGLIEKYQAQFIFLGDGELRYKKYLTRIAKKYPRNVKVFFKLDLPLAQKLYAASDFFLVPSRFEPCGLTQMMAMRYGSIPIVRSVGGLKDTVSSRNGYTFKDYSTIALQKVVSGALRDFSLNSKLIENKRQNGMKTDFSWHSSALKYVKLYQKMIK